MVDPIRRKLLKTGAAAAAMAAPAPSLFARQSGNDDSGRFYERGNVRIRYEETGSGFPLLLISGGGLNGSTRFLHDCRRTAARNLIRASVPERVAMLLTGHKSRAIFDRYNIINEQELIEAGDQLVEYLEQHAQATPARRRPHAAGTAAPRPAQPLRLVRRTTA